VRIAVVGAGAIGAVLAAAASSAGNEASLRVRSPFASLEVVRDGTVHRVTASVSDTAVGPPAEVVFLTVKMTDTASAAPHLAALCGPETLTVIVQNGLDHTARVTPYLPEGAGPACPALAYVAAERVAPGRVHHVSGNLLVVPTAHQATVARALGADVDVKGTDDIVTAAWRKLLGNIAANPLTSITRRHMDVLRSPGMADLARSLITETVDVGRAEGAQLREADIDRAVERLSAYGAETGSSMLHDRMAGRPTEHQYLTGEVVRRGARRHIDVPTNTIVLALLEALDGS
jgi:2-dehydropantoate 2-reductase